MTEPTQAGFIEEIVVCEDAEDVKRIEIHGVRDTVSFAVTDESMGEFLKVAEQVFDDIHADMAEMRGIIEGRFDEREGSGTTED